MAEGIGLLLAVDERALPIVDSDDARVDVAGAADVLLGGLRHEGRRDPVEEGDLLDPVLVDRVPVRRGDRVGVAHVDLVLAVPGLALRELNRNPGGVHPAADWPQVLLVHRRGEDVVVEDVGDRGGEARVVLLVRLGVALLVEIELEFGGELRRVAHLAAHDGVLDGGEDLVGHQRGRGHPGHGHGRQCNSFPGSSPNSLR